MKPTAPAALHMLIATRDGTITRTPMFTSKTGRYLLVASTIALGAAAAHAGGMFPDAPKLPDPTHPDKVVQTVVNAVKDTAKSVTPEIKATPPSLTQAPSIEVKVGSGSATF